MAGRERETGYERNPADLLKQGVAGLEKDYQRLPAYYAPLSVLLEDFRAYIASAYGVSLLGELRADGHFHGIGTDQDRHGAKPFRYCCHDDPPENIYFQDLKRGFEGTWFPQGQAPLDPVEREARRRGFEARRFEREAETLVRHTKAAARAMALWRRASPASAGHPYLSRKGVGVRPWTALLAALGAAGL